MEKLYPVIAMVVRIKEHEDLSPLVGILREYGAKRVVLFGSTARGDERPGSDVDLACEGLPPGRFFEAWGELLLFTGREVDLVDLSVVKEPLRRCIEEEAGLLYEAERSFPPSNRYPGSTIGFCGSMGLRRGCSSWGLRFCPLDLKCCPASFLIQAVSTEMVPPVGVCPWEYTGATLC